MSSVADRTHRAVAGALRDTINQHGPVTEQFIESATKRVVAQIRSAAECAPILDADDPDGRIRAAVEAGHKRYQKLRHGHDRLVEQNRRLREELESLRGVAA